MKKTTRAQILNLLSTKTAKIGTKITPSITNPSFPSEIGTKLRKYLMLLFLIIF